MRKKTILKIERDLKKRAKKMHLGKKRTGAYVYGTLRKIRGNPSTPQVDPPWNYGIYAGTGRGVIRKKGIETKIERLRKIVSERQNAVVQGVRVDLYSASAIVSVYDKLNPENQRKFLKMSVPKMADVAFKIINARDLKSNPVNEVLEILPQDQILAEYKKGGEGQRAKLMFTSKPMSGMSASQLVRKIGNYNNFSWRRVSPFLGKLHFMNQSLTLPMTFRVGREYSPAIYIENVDMPRYANRLIEYAKKNLKADEASYTPVARRVRLWWD